MVIDRRICFLVFTIAFASQGGATAGIIQVGDLNIIDQAGNPSDGLRYLEMTYSDGLTEATALANAQATYSNSRLATPSEFDDLFAAAGISYDGATTASGGFDVGGSPVISSGANYDGAALAGALGYTYSSGTNIWTDPDRSASSATTRDFLQLLTTEAAVYQYASSPPNSVIGWLIVSEVPEPSTLAALGGLLGMGLIGRWWRRRKAA